MTDINISKIIIDNDNLIIKDSVARTSLNSLSTNIHTDINNLIYNINCNKFSTSTSYDIGDYVIYEEQLYIFNQTHLSGEWNLNEVTPVRLADELKNKITDAPNDGTSYVRKNNNWAVASSEGGSGIGLGDIISFSSDTAIITTGERFIDELYNMNSDEFSPAINYQVGDYCIYKGNLYKFTQLHSATTWTTTDVIKVNITNELKSKAPNTNIWIDITNDCTWSTNYLTSYSAYYNPACKLVSVAITTISTGIPNQAILGTLSKSVVQRINVFATYDVTNSKRMNLVVYPSTDATRANSLVASFSVDSSSKLTMSTNALIPVSN